MRTHRRYLAQSADVADALNETRAKVGQSLASDQKRWAKDSFLTAFRNDLFEHVQRLGGVVTIAELIELTLLLRPPVKLSTLRSNNEWQRRLLVLPLRQKAPCQNLDLKLEDCQPNP